MNKDLRSTLSAIVILIVAYGLIFLMKQFSVLVDKPATGDLATWVGAAFALAAFIGTTRLTLRQNEKEKQEKLEHAKLLSIAIVHELEMILASLGSLLGVVGAMEKGQQVNDPNLPYTPEAVDKLQKQLSELPRWAVSELVPLLILKNGCAINLAAGGEKINQALKLVTLQIANRRHYEDEGMKRIGFSLRGKLEDAMHNLSTAYEACEAVVLTFDSGRA